MNQFLDWVFGFEAGTFGRPGTGIGFANEVPLWVILCALLALGVLVWLSYKGLAGRAWTRFMLGSMRVLLLGLLIVLALGPQIERHRELVEPDRVIMLLDVSGSMNTPEILVDGSRATRASQLNELLESNTKIIDQINSDSTIDLYTFSDRLQSSEVFSVDLSGVQDRAGTTLGGSMQRAINNAGTSPISGIVVFSDGRSHDEVPGALIESLISSGVPVISIPIGSVEPVRDASIGIIESPQAVFAEDRVPVRVQVNSDGYRDGEELTVELLDQATGRTLDSTTIVVGENENTNGNEGNFSSADLSHQFADAGNKRMLVRIRPSDQTQDLIEENNQQAIELSVVSEPMRVLYIDGHPRWEYRYLKNLLMREQTIDATTMLIASDRRFIEEGQPINGPIPDTLEAWEPFDVVVLGDIRSDLFSESQLSTLKEHIETKGCGLLWIAGEGSTPSSWSSSELSSLLPYVSGKSDSISNQSQQDSPSVMSLTSEAVRIGMLVSDEGDLSEVSDPSTGWSILRWTHTISDEDLKPGISVLARGDNLENGESRALVTSMRYGSGQVGYVGTDEIWRWRYGRGEDLPEQFWLPMIRTLARGTIARRAAPASLVIAPEQISPGDDVRISLELFDSAVLEGLPEQIDARIRPMSTSGSEINIQLNGNTNRRSGLWTPNEPGMYTLSTQHPLIGSEPISRVLRVHASWDESVNPNTNHAYLESLSQRTDGQVLQNDELAELPDLLPNRTRITTLPPETTAMWDRPIVLILLVLLLSVEWIGRRILRLA
jgi:hypothetical protein